MKALLFFEAAKLRFLRLKQNKRIEYKLHF